MTWGTSLTIVAIAALGGFAAYPALSVPSAIRAALAGAPRP